MTIIVSELSENDREQWEKLYYGYADFYNMPIDAAILDTIWSWIFDKNNLFFALIAKNETGDALGLAHCRDKLSQNRSAQDQAQVIQRLKANGSNQMAEAMQRHGLS